MARNLPTLDYTNRDYDSLVASMLELAALKFPEWTDRSQNDIARMLVELFAYVGDTILYYQDRVANEAFLATARERRSVIDLLALIGYTLATPSPASVELEIRAPNTTTTPVAIRPGARFATQARPGRPAVEFIYWPGASASFTIPRDGRGGEVGPARITVIHAVPVERELLGTAAGEANQGFRLAQSPVLLPRNPDDAGSLVVEVDGVRWERRGTLLHSNSIEAHYTVSIDDQDRAEIVFGDGRYGKIPVGEVRASYLIGGGAAGNVGPGTITVVKSGIEGGTISVTNPRAASGGADRESIEHARELAPLVFRSFDRAVTAGDYAALARNFPGVARAVAVAPAWNYVDLYAVAAGGLNLTPELRADLTEYFEDRRMITTIVAVREPSFVSVDLDVTVEIQPTHYRRDVVQRVEDALSALFAVEQVDFGTSFYLSRIYEIVQDVQGVAFANVRRFSGRRSTSSGQEEPVSPADGVLTLLPMDFPRKGAITITLSGGLS